LKGEIHGPEMQAEIRLRKGDSNPIFFKTTKRKECLTLSNALARSSLRMKPFSFLDRLE